ncbi:MAG: HAD-IIB family hydrolase [Acidobacteriota bacterium]|jgi:sucrose-phosphate synthase|nr:HAD-IIB family hydrolase [Acidobacteriota bacterium]
MASKPLYIQMFSIHGLIRGNNLELGRDADTGGQTLYVVELAKNLSRLAGVRRVDLFTRLISDPRVSEDYAQEIEELNEKCHIVRMRCGGLKYIRKERLWTHLDEFVNRTITFIKRQGEVPDLFHGHYADAGYVSRRLARYFGVPFIFTGHSLGRSKQARLLENGIKPEEIERRFNMRRRIAAEEDVLRHVDLVVASTSQEVRTQYGQYENKDNPAYAVIPPGIDLDKFHPYYMDNQPEHPQHDAQIFAQAYLQEELHRFLIHPDRPLVLTLCRPEKRKNISGLIRAYGEDADLQAMANLAIFAGIRKDIEAKEENEREVLTEMLLLMDRYDLYGRMAIPKRHDSEYEVPALYRIAAEKRGVFVNVALTEPFGLTLIEASASGVPLVATRDGGPHDIIANLKNGILVDPNSSREISAAIRKILTHSEEWKRMSRNGIVNVRQYYTWDAHVQFYSKRIRDLIKSGGKAAASRRPAIGRRLAALRYFLICDIDDTLTGGPKRDLEKLVEDIKQNRNNVGFGVATGRDRQSALNHLKANRIPMPDVLIAAVGTEIYYGEDLLVDNSWNTRLSHHWKPEKIRALLADLDFLTPQPEEAMQTFKISYFMRPGKDRLARIHKLLSDHKLRYSLVYSSERDLDILPFRASKGKAVRHFSRKWDIPPGHILACGDSGNDAGMLRGECAAVVVANHKPELEPLRESHRVYFARSPYAAGIREGIAYFQWWKRAGGEGAS